MNNNEGDKPIYNEIYKISQSSINKVLELMYKSEIEQYELLDKYSHCLMTIVKLCYYPGKKELLMLYICKTTIKYCKELQKSLKNEDYNNINCEKVVECCEDIIKV